MIKLIAVAGETPKTTFIQANQQFENFEILGCCQRRWQLVPATDNEKKIPAPPP